MSFSLYLGDCIEGIKKIDDAGVDHTISDPPYSDAVHGNFETKRRDRKFDREDITFGALGEEEATVMAREIVRVTKRWILVFGDDWSAIMWRTKLMEAGARYVRLGAWIKTDAMPSLSGTKPAPGMEMIYIAHNSKTKADGGENLRWNGGGRPATWIGPVRGENAEERVHPTQKPDWLMAKLVTDFTDPGDLILDPYAGSGTTGVAAIRNGRRFIGFERDPSYHAAAMKRIGNSREQRSLF